MATDATGTPTSPDSIPKYNTAVDAPSGKGFNTAMDALQTIFTQLKAGTLASGKIAAAGITPGSNTQVLTTTGGATVWAAPTGTGIYRKATAKTINTTVTETDLLNGEITIGANVIGSSGVVRLLAEGDFLMNAAGPVAATRFKLKLGGTTLLDTNTIAATMTTTALRFGWRIVCTISNLGATNAQWSHMEGEYTLGAATGATGFATGEGNYIVNNISGGIGLASFSGGNASAIDTTAAKLLELSVILGSSSVNNEIVLKHALVEVL